MKTKFEKESQDLESETETLRQKVQQMREEAAKLQESAIISKANIKHLEVELKEVKTVKRENIRVGSATNFS